LNTKRLPDYPIFTKYQAGRVSHPAGINRAEANWNLFTRTGDPAWIVSIHPARWLIPAVNTTKNSKFLFSY